MLALTGEAPATLSQSRFVPSPWVVWAAASLCLLVIGLPRIIGFAPDDPDDYMRLAQVRDLVAGQSWWDVRQYRMAAPAGADMHWSRLVDLPLAAFLIFFRQLFSEPWASVATMTAVPLMQLGLAMGLLRSLMRSLGGSEIAVLAASLLPLAFPLLLSNFMPLRIDHHGWQGLAALAAVWLVIRGRRVDTFLAGIVAAAGLTVSLEALPVAAITGGLLAARYWFSGKPGHAGYLAGLAVAAPLLGLLTRPADILWHGYCDVLSWPHFVSFATAAGLALTGRYLPGQQDRSGRFCALLPIPLIAAPVILLPLGDCAVNPFSGMDPVLKSLWLDRVGEGLPLTFQPPSVATMLVWVPLIVVAGWRIAMQGTSDAERRNDWSLLALLALGLAAYSMLVMRAGLGAQLLAVPFATILVTHYMPRARALASAGPRIAATLACLLFATPMAVSAAFKPLDKQFAPGGEAETSAPALRSSARKVGDCEIDRLAALRPAKLFAPLDLGPEILARTHHGVVMSGYHRNQARMLDVINAFAGPPRHAEAIVRANGASYVVACMLPEKLAVYVPEKGASLAGDLIAGRTPKWLEPVPGFEGGSLRIYKLR